MARLKSSMSLLTTAANTVPGIAETLIATAVDLFVALSVACGYNAFRAKIPSIQAACINFAGILLNRLQHESSLHPEGLSFAERNA